MIEKYLKGYSVVYTMRLENRNRIMILNYLELEDKMTITQIAKKLNISRPTVYLHLENLEKRELIKRSKNVKKKGAPVTIELCDKEVSDLRKKNLIKFLKVFELKGEITNDEMHKNFPTSEKGGITPAQIDAMIRGFISDKTFLTEKGKKYLQNHKEQTNEEK